MKKFFAMALTALLMSGTAFAEGLTVGSPVNAFYVRDVTGPAAGTKLCYRCRYGDRPVVSIFTRSVNPGVTSLIQEVDSVVGKHQNEDMKAFVVLLTDEPENGEAALKKVASEAQVTHTPLTTFDGTSGPPAYKIQQDAEVTVMMWVDGKLKVNETCKAADLTKDRIAAVVGKTSQILN